MAHALHSNTSAQEQDSKLPPAHDWRTTDDHERQRRRERAESERPAIALNAEVPNLFNVRSRSGLGYQVEVRDIDVPRAACSCVDFRINGLGTCKHVEAVISFLQHRPKFRKEVRRVSSGSAWILPSTDRATLTIEGDKDQAPAALRSLFDEAGRLDGAASAEEAVEILQQDSSQNLLLSIELAPWLEARQQARERQTLRREYELKVQAGEWPQQETLLPLFPYQREGMLHLAFTERALLADEMGLGKTIQAIAACALLKRMGKAQRVLIVTPASLKTEWEEQIRRFTALEHRLVYGGRLKRLGAYTREGAPFFTLVNYEQVIADALDINMRLQPEIVVLDEAQRIKNWNTKTAQAVKRLRSRYAFVLTGTPIENRIDELYSLIDYLNPAIFGPLFRFNREFYSLDERGRPSDYRNLALLQERLRPVMLRRRKLEIETELPERSDHVRFLPLSPAQEQAYQGFEAIVARLVHAARRRPLTPAEQDKLMRTLAMMRMTCDTNYILDESDRACPKLGELEKIMEECRENPDVKVIVFSEWERMLQLVRGVCQKTGMGVAWHTGSVPQQRRRSEINRFKTDPQCRVFLSTDSGGVGLNLQNASVIVNCDLPWNPARLEQRIARAWRKNQKRAVTVINLVSEKTIEHRMLATIADKRGLADGVLDSVGDLSKIKLRTGRSALLARLEQIVIPVVPKTMPPPSPPADPGQVFAQQLACLMGGRIWRCEEHYLSEQEDAPSLVVIVERDAAQWQPRIEDVRDQAWKDNPAKPAKLIVLDRATNDALEAMIAAGLIKRPASTVRELKPGQASATPPLSSEEQQRIAAFRAQYLRKLKTAQVLLSADLAEEALSPARDALHALGCALAVARRLPPPPDVSAYAGEPWKALWPADAHVALSPLFTEPSSVSSEALKALSSAG
ncbi:MAG: DEAD/DEAH box helicase [Opitutaceae bacterium]|jgi:superfamily II DNA or RNA helicase